MMLDRKVLFITAILMMELVVFIDLSGADPPVSLIIVDDSGGQGHLTIQDALDSASDGDVIQVFSGDYSGDLIINKEVNLIGAGASITYILGTGNGIVIEASNVSISGFFINSTYGNGIVLDGVSNCIIDRCIVQSTIVGIGISGSNNTVIDCEILDNDKGIVLGNVEFDLLLMGNRDIYPFF